MLDRPFPTYPNGFPRRPARALVASASAAAGSGNIAASGTEIIARLGERAPEDRPLHRVHFRRLRVPVAAHEATVPLEELYAACRAAREMLTGEHAVGRVIARPFVGQPGGVPAHPATGAISRSSRYEPTLLDRLVERGRAGGHGRQGRRPVRGPRA